MVEVQYAKNAPISPLLSDREEELSSRGSEEYTSSYISVVRAKTILLAAEGVENKQIGAQLGIPRQIVSKWRKRFFEERLAGLEDRPRRGRPRVFSP